MASASVLQRLTQRARQAEEIIVQLKAQIETVKTAAAASASKPEEEKLREENTRLREEVERLKVKLVVAEVQNGVKQVPLPVLKKAVAPSPVAVLNNEPNAGDSMATTDQKVPQEKKGKKEKGPTGKTEKTKEAPGDPKVKKGKGDQKGAPAEPEKMDVSRLDFRVGKIVGVKKHPDADSLYIEEVDLGEDKHRTIVSGLVKHVPIEEMQDRLAVFMCNLKPAKMRGILSEGMIMCASCPEKVEILIPPPGSQIGDKVFVKEYPGEPDALLNPKKKIWETLKPDLKTDSNKVATFKGAPLIIEGKGQVVAPTRPDTQIS